MHRKFVLLVEDNHDDVELTLRALSKSDTTVEVVVAHDGVEHWVSYTELVLTVDAI